MYFFLHGGPLARPDAWLSHRWNTGLDMKQARCMEGVGELDVTKQESLGLRTDFGSTGSLLPLGHRTVSASHLWGRVPSRCLCKKFLELY